MEFKGLLLIDASPALLNVMNRLADVFTAKTASAERRKVRKTVAEPADELRTAVEPAAVDAVPEPVSEEPEAAVPDELPAQPESTSAETAPEAPQPRAVTLDAVRSLMAQKAKADREAVKKALTECGAARIGDLPEEKYREFYDKLLAL